MASTGIPRKKQKGLEEEPTESAQTHKKKAGKWDEIQREVDEVFALKLLLNDKSSHKK